MKLFSPIAHLIVFFMSIFALPAVGQEPGTSSAEASERTREIGLSIGTKAGTAGFGGEATMALTPWIHLRLGGAYFKYEIQLEAFQSEVKGSSYIRTGAIGLIANIHPSRYYYLSGGVLYNLLEAGIYGIPSKPITIGNIEATPEEIGSLEVNFKPGLTINPYLGIGLGRVVSKNRKITFNLDLGTAFMDSPKADLTSTGMLTPTSSEEQRRQLNENIAWIQFYPILNFQLNYRLF